MALRSVSLLVLLAALPACTLFSGAARTEALGAYTGTVTTPDFTVEMDLVLAEAVGRVSGTAEMRRGDLVIGYAVSGTRTGDALDLDLASEGADLDVKLTVADGGARLDGTATGGDLSAATLAFVRDTE